MPLCLSHKLANHSAIRKTFDETDCQSSAIMLDCHSTAFLPILIHRCGFHQLSFALAYLGGCQCAGPFSQHILGISSQNNKRIELALLDKHEVIRLYICFRWR